MNPLNVLYLEDKESDFRSVHSYIGTQKVSIHLQRIQSIEALTQLEITSPYDLILTDFDFLDLILKWRLQQALETPIVVLSNLQKEESAVDCIRKGATDYVSKQRLGRLGNILGNAASTKVEEGHQLQDLIKARWSTFLANSSDYVLVLDLIGRVLCANGFFQGLKAQDLIGKELHEVIGEYNRPIYRENFLMVVKQGKTVVFESLSAATFDTVTIQIQMSPVFVGSEVKEVLLVLTDITQRKKQEKEIRDCWGYVQLLSHYDKQKLFETNQQLRLELDGRKVADRVRRADWQKLDTSERLYRSLARVSPVGIFRINRLGECVFVNKRWREITGMEGEEALGLGWLQAIHPQDRDRFFNRRILVEVKRRKEPFSSELRIQKPHGKVSWVLARIMADIDPLGRVLDYVGTITDITANKQVERHLNRKKEQYRSLIETIPYGIQEMNLSGVITYANAVISQIFGYKNEELVGMPFCHLLATEAEKEKLQKYKTYVMKERPDPSPFIIKGLVPSGKWIDIEVAWNYKRDDQGEIIGFIGILTDITAQKRAEEARDKLKQQAQLSHAGRLTALGEMASGMAHEINQPLTIIRLIADSLKSYFNKRGASGHEADGVETIITQVHRAAKIIKNVRFFSRVNDISRPIHLTEPINLALSFFREQFRIHQIQLTVVMDHGLPKVSVNPQKFEQVVVNFLSNAKYAVLKHSEESRIAFQKLVRVRLYFDPDRESVIFEVSDNGMGMSPEVRDRCMEPFYTTKEVGEGTGLGLSIVHGIIQEFKMQIEVESEIGGGATFRILARTRK
ncbi:MAG: hypothetical protein COB67_10490 [SAR324 cluster bacterium]|uniref:histidine kinase n=1 Tax=SAR324 cluster bacterium TaxID=2024889 RepID=A0A2A4SXI4_9DELT|nr:MAG: hypothetical protein COB67_10490 [SAR324 cluster bacterium]